MKKKIIKKTGVTTDSLAIMVQNGFVEISNKFQNGFDLIDKRFDRVENRLDKVEQRLNNVEQRLDVMVDTLSDHKHRIVRLERKTGILK